MKLLFLTLLDFDNIEEHNIYTDLLREFYHNGHTVCVVSPVERRKHGETRKMVVDDRLSIVKVKIGNIQKTNIIEKGISTLTLEPKIVAAIKKYYANIKFDLVLYSTPPITLQKAVSYVKKRDNAKTYLMLKDIFPQNAIDLGMLSESGVKGILYKFFRNKEKKLYKISDCIGCMSQANVDYVLKHNLEVDSKKVEICPNCIEVVDKSVDEETRKKIREKYGIPMDKKVFIYGGNLGKPQGIPFIIECLKHVREIKEVFFLIVGDGTEYGVLEEYVRTSKQENLKLMKRLPKEDYDTVVGACDVGMIFLEHRFTIPNFPSRLLSYMQAKLPVLAVTDANTDVGKVIVDGGFGWWCESNHVHAFCDKIYEIITTDIEKMGCLGFVHLNKLYSAREGCVKILNHIKSKGD